MIGLESPSWRAFTNLQPLLGEVRSFPMNQWVLSGSVVMALNDIDVNYEDVDMFVTKPLYEALKCRGWEEKTPRSDHPPMLEWFSIDRRPGKRMLKINAWYAWDDEALAGGHGIQVVETAFSCAVSLKGGIQCMSLPVLRDWKHRVCAVVPKHQEHIDLIDQKLGWLPTWKQQLEILATYTLGLSDYDFCRGIYFMLMNAWDLENETGLPWQWHEAHMQRLAYKGFTFRRRLPSSNWPVWDLTQAGADLVTAGLESEANEAAA